MFDAIHQFLYDFNAIVVPAALATGGYFGWRFWRALQEATPEPTGVPTRSMPRRNPQRPGAGTPSKPVQQEFLGDRPATASVEAGRAGHDSKAHAATLRIKTDDRLTGSTTELEQPKLVTPSDEVGKLFAGLDDTLKPKAEDKPEPPPADVIQRANRLTELGFHHSIATTKANESAAPAAESAPAATAAPAPAPELDDILARLDRVLAEDKPAAAAPAPAAPPAEPAAAPARASEPAPAPTAPAGPKAPLWARADATDEEAEAPKAEPGKQLGLFDEDKKQG